MKHLLILAALLVGCSVALAQSQINGVPVTVAGTGVLQGSAGTTGTGNVAFSTGAIFDCTFCTNVEASALVGTVPFSSIPGSIVSWSTTSPVAVTNSNNGDVVDAAVTGSVSVTLPAINTNSITPNAFQGAIYNASTGPATITPSSPTLINGLTSVTVPPLGGAFVFADGGNGPSGQYNYTAFFTNSLVGNGAGFQFYFQDPASGANGGWWTLYSNSTSGNMCLGAIVDAFTTTHNGICLDRTSDTSAALTSISLGNVVDASVSLNEYAMPTALGTVPTVTINTCSSSSITVNGGMWSFDFLLTGSGGGTCGITVTWPIALAATNSIYCSATDVGQHTPVNQSNKASRILTFQTGSTTAATDDVQMQCSSH